MLRIFKLTCLVIGCYSIFSLLALTVCWVLLMGKVDATSIKSAVKPRDNEMWV